MKLFLDSANPDDITRWSQYVDGITSNPILLKKNNLNIETFYELVKDQFRYIFIQINKEDDLFFHDSKIIYKIPMTFDNLQLMRLIQKRGSKLCATTVYDTFQFNLACDLGCTFSIVLCHKNQDKEFLNKCINIKNKYNYKTQIIAASFRNKSEVENAILSGADYATLPSKVLDECFSNTFVTHDCEEYREHL